ncbi:MAG: caspase family protein [Anaerolineae bacterium]|nr:caspase family protein [Anaerolineae bacterium]
MNETAHTQVRRALLIGINRYPRFPAERQLYGAVNDVLLMAKVLREHYAFGPITGLVDRQATRRRILGALDALVAETGVDDGVVIYYSGHGSRRRDKEGDEPDGWDETIVPFDSGRGYGQNADITDDEIYARLLQLSTKTPYITLIFDSCHSGTITRDPFGPGARWVPDDQTPAEELPEPDIPPAMRDAIVRGARSIGKSGWLPLSERYTLIAGCDDDESAYEQRVEGEQGVYHGALTYYLAQELLHPAQGATYRDVFERVRAQVTAMHPQQHPQAEGAQDRLVFGVGKVEVTPAIPVIARRGELVTLAGGAAHGVTAGSGWAIYSQGAHLPAEQVAPLGEVEIERVGAVSAAARVRIETAPGAIAVDSRAVEVTHRYGEMRLVVDVHPSSTERAAWAEQASAVASLEAQIRGSALLRLREEGEPVDVASVRATLLAPRHQVRAGDPAPQLGPLSEATWALIGDGAPIAPPHLARELGVTALLRENLEKIARYRNVLALKNPDPHALLRDKVRFVLVRKVGEAWVDVDLDERMVFRDGDAIDLAITVLHDAPVYVSVLDLGLMRGISLLYPPNRPSQRFDPLGTPILIAQRAGGQIGLRFPAAFPGDEGTETVKLFATTHPADFTWLQQSGVRAIDAQRQGAGFGTPLQRLFEAAYTGGGIRGDTAVHAPPEGEWIAIERTFTMRRR